MRHFIHRLKGLAIAFSVFLGTLALGGCGDEPHKSEPEAVDSPAPVPIIGYSVENVHPHDKTLYTEGLLFHDGKLYESSGAPAGLAGARSVIGVSDIATGTFTTKVELDRQKYFGEGIVFFGDKLYQLTYKNQLGFVYDARTFKQVGTFNYANLEGWGMTTDSTHLIMSDGTNVLTYLDPESMKPVKTLKVTEYGAALDNLNELEFIKGFIYANVWMTNYIVKIDPKTGEVVGKMDFSNLAREAEMKNPDVDVLNGIAYDPASDKVYVTGKMWPNIYQISFEH